jgi:hypothetical protein
METIAISYERTAKFAFQRESQEYLEMIHCIPYHSTGPPRGDKSPSLAC